MTTENLLYTLFLLIPIFSLFFLRWAYKKRKGAPPPTDRWWTKLGGKKVYSDKLLVLLGLVGCHALIWYFWPELWWTLARSPLFWLDHLVIFLALVVFRKKNKKGESMMMPVAGWALTILFIGNAWSLYNFGAMKSAEARVKAQSEKEFLVIAPLGKFSEAILNTYGMVFCAHGPILVQTDKEMVEREDCDVKNKWETPLQPSRWLRFQSRASEPVEVTISR